MAITTMDGVVAALGQQQNRNINKASITSVAGGFVSHWATAGYPTPGSFTLGNTTTGLVPTSATQGAIQFTDPTGGPYSYLGRFDIDADAGTGSVILYDRLFHVGSIAANSLATTTLGSQPGYSGRVNANYDDTELWLEINAAISATATTVAVHYLDQSGAAGVTPALSIQSLGAGRMIPLLFATGDTGISQIVSVVVGGTVATTGSFNVLVIRRMASQSALIAGIGSTPKSDPISMGLRRIYDSSCLCLMESTTGTSTGQLLATVGIIQG